MNQTATTRVLVIGAGLMGAGIAQVAAQGAAHVYLYDARSGAASEARAKLAITLRTLVDKGKLTAQAMSDTLARVQVIDTLQQVRGIALTLALEAIIEDLAAKRVLLTELEAVVNDDCIIASNTSSFSITALANGMRLPGRLVGMHFFNPAPVMKLVEIVSGLHTQPEVAERTLALAQAWGKQAIRARSTPGFIVNRIARPYYAEALVLLQEQAATPLIIDACLRAAGFRMGPCELMDLIGHDTNFAVTRSLYDANFQDKRYLPSVLQSELVAGGLLGRKSGRGFYEYPAGAPALAPQSCSLPSPSSLVVHGAGAAAEWLQTRVTALPTSLVSSVTRVTGSDWTGLQIGSARLVLTDGRCAQQIATLTGVRDVAVLDRCHSQTAASVAYAVAAQAGAQWRDETPRWLAALGLEPQRVADVPGLIVTRTLAMLINEAADAVQQGTCTAQDADIAMKLGTNYPAGPFEWLRDWSALGVIGVLQALDARYRGDRYRISPWLWRTAAEQR